MEYWSPDPSVHYPIEQIRGLESYKDLISNYGWEDVTTERVAKSGNVTFQHPTLPGIKYQVYNNGYIRINTGARWTPLVSPIQDRGRDFAEPIKSLNDYDIKFDWLKKYLIKKYNIKLGLNKIRGISPKSTPEEIARAIDSMIDKNPSFAKKEEIAMLKKLGLYNPSEFSADMLKVAELGLF